MPTQTENLSNWMNPTWDTSIWESLIPKKMPKTHSLNLSDLLIFCSRDYYTKRKVVPMKKGKQIIEEFRRRNKNLFSILGKNDR